MRAAAAAKLDVIALTDHDTTLGWLQAREALAPDLTLVPGAELSCAAQDADGRLISVHLLAYLFDPTSEAIAAEQRRLRRERRSRLYTMARVMADEGFPLDPEAVLADLDEDAPAGRPHLARSLVAAGVVSTVDEAFDRYLADGRGYSVPRTDTPVADAVEMVAAAGGVSVLAHAFAHGRGRTVTAKTIAELAALGLDGLEVEHPNHDRQARAELAELARELELLPTGSSDYHGANKPIPLGAETTDPGVFTRLVERASGSGLVTGRGAHD